MKKLFEKLNKLGYTFTNKRVLGNPDHTSLETREKDLIQEYALIVMWIYEKQGIWIEVRRTNFFKQFRFQAYFNEKPLTGELGGYVSHEVPTEAYLAAIEYTLNKLI